MIRLPEGPWAARLLFAPSLVYRSAVALRNRLYDAGLLRARRLPCPVVSIGNLTVGGTGKTPLASFLAGALLESGYRIGVVSRGYRRRGGRSSLLVSDGRTLLQDALSAGDEPYLIARDNPSVAVAVGADRAEAARLLLRNAEPEVIVLDDAFQHRRLHRDIDLLLLDGRRPWGNGRLLPAGPLREPITAASRADALVVTRPEGRFAPALGAILERRKAGAPVFYGRIEPRGFARADGEPVARGALQGLAAFAVSGIARPERFEEDLASVGVHVVGTRRFRDHHPYSPRDLEESARAARSARAEVVVTTEKDLVRMPAWPAAAPPVYALALRVTFPEGSDLVAWLLDRLQGLRGRGARRAAP